MAANARKYRDEVYRLRSHPDAKPFILNDERDSFFRVYLSIIPFLMLEYLAEARLDSPISGLMFPTGFLLFWAYYYTYYRPGTLEAKLSHAADGAFADFPKIILGVAIWFVKATVFGVVQFATDFFYERTEKRATKAIPPVRLAYSQPRPKREHAYQHAQTKTHARPAPPPPPKKEQPLPPMPADLSAALKTLGLIGDVREWKAVHSRYRDLAKRFHPDHNPDAATGAGRQFMLYDAAYRKLLRNKSRYFHEAK